MAKAVVTKRKHCMTCCRQQHIQHIVQQWQSWVLHRRSLRQRGLMVSRLHQGFTLRHAWQHWPWLAGGKVILHTAFHELLNFNQHVEHVHLTLCTILGGCIAGSLCPVPSSTGHGWLVARACLILQAMSWRVHSKSMQHAWRLHQGFALRHA